MAHGVVERVVEYGAALFRRARLFTLRDDTEQHLIYVLRPISGAICSRTSSPYRTSILGRTRWAAIGRVENGVPGSTGTYWQVMPGTLLR